MKVINATNRSGVNQAVKNGGKMSHSVTITLTGNQIIEVGRKQVNIHDIQSIELTDNYRIKKVTFKKDKKDDKC